ncbi:MAG TPA: hypothetical protein VGW38_05985, partial [Chloroflexota bacterium]|nr:hypothetical protein [Chloroflexota bacterium]
LMTTVVFGQNEAELRRKLGDSTAEAQRARGRIVGTAPMIAQQLRDLAAAGLDRVMLRWDDLDDTAGLRALGEGVLGRLS